jgi:hypothetical protein
LPLSLAMDDGNFHCGGGGGGGGSVVAVAAVVVAAVNYRDQWQWRLMVAAALDRGHATTSWCSKRAAIRSIVFGCITMATTRNRVMAVALEEAGNSKGKKSDGNCNKVGSGKR